MRRKLWLIKYLLWSRHYWAFQRWIKYNWFWFWARLRGEKPPDGYCGSVMFDETEWNPTNDPAKYIARRKKLAICVRNLSH